MLGAEAERLGQEGGELGRAHLARGEGELAVVGAAGEHMALDRHIVGRVREHHLGALARHEAGINVGIANVAADEAMIAEPPKVAGAGDGRARYSDRRLVGGIGSIVEIGEQHVDFAALEAGEIDLLHEQS